MRAGREFEGRVVSYPRSFPESSDERSRRGAEDGRAPDEADATSRWQQALFDVAIEEMSHLTAVWNITQQLTDVAAALASGGDRRVQQATEHLVALSRQANRGFELNAPVLGEVARSTRPSSPPTAPPVSNIIDGVERVQGEHLELIFETKRCIHARFCVTGRADHQ